MGYDLQSIDRNFNLNKGSVGSEGLWNSNVCTTAAGGFHTENDGIYTLITVPH